MMKMKFLYEKGGRNFGFTVEASTDEECFELGIDAIEKDDGTLLNYYPIEFNE